MQPLFQLGPARAHVKILAERGNMRRASGTVWRQAGRTWEAPRPWSSLQLLYATLCYRPALSAGARCIHSRFTAAIRPAPEELLPAAGAQRLDLCPPGR